MPCTTDGVNVTGVAKRPVLEIICDAAIENSAVETPTVESKQKHHREHHVPMRLTADHLETGNSETTSTRTATNNTCHKFRAAATGYLCKKIAVRKPPTSRWTRWSWLLSLFIFISLAVTACVMRGQFPSFLQDVFSLDGQKTLKSGGQFTRGKLSSKKNGQFTGKISMEQNPKASMIQERNQRLAAWVGNQEVPLICKKEPTSGDIQKAPKTENAQFTRTMTERRSLSGSYDTSQSWKDLSASCPVMTATTPPTPMVLVPPQNIRAFCEPGKATIFFDIPAANPNGWLYHVVSENDSTLRNLTSCGATTISGMPFGSVHQFKVYSVSFEETSSSSSVLSNKVRCDNTPPIPLNVKLVVSPTLATFFWDPPMFRTDTIQSVKVLLNPGNVTLTGASSLTQIDITSGFAYDGSTYDATLMFTNHNGDSLGVQKSFVSTRDIKVESGEVLTLTAGEKHVYKSIWIKSGGRIDCVAAGKGHLVVDTFIIDGEMKVKDMFIEASNLTINAGGVLHADYLGYSADTDPGFGCQWGGDTNHLRAKKGGAHGGKGGWGNNPGACPGR